MFYFLTSIIISCSFLFLDAAGQNMLGPGTWSVVSTQPCENDAEMPWRVHLRRHKLNRTHDAFDGEVSALADLDDSYGARVDVCKMVEGGCKPFINNSQECLPCIARKYASENTRTVIVALGIDPPDFPIPKSGFHPGHSTATALVKITDDIRAGMNDLKLTGEYRLDNYLVDVEELSKKGVYGEYHGTGFIVKDGQDIACLRMSVKFEPIDNFGSLPTLYG